MTVNDENNDENNDDEGADDDPKTFTQEELEKLVRREVGQTKRKAVSTLLEELGVEDVEELKAKIAKANKPAPKSKAKADDKEEGEGKGEPEVDVEELRSSIKKDFQRQLDEVNLDNEIEAIIVDRYSVTMKAAKRMRKLVDVELNADEDEIETAMEDLEKDMPNLFTKGEDDDDDDDRGRQDLSRNRRRDSNPGRSPRRPRGSGKDTTSAARTLLHERHPQTKK